MFSLICVTVNIQVFSSGSNAGIETSTSLINAIVDNALHVQLIHQSDAASNRPHPVFFSGRLAAPDFIMKYILIRAVR